MGKSSETAQNLIKQVGSVKVAQNLKSKYIKATKSQFSRITKNTHKAATIKESLQNNLPKLKNLKNLKPNKELNKSLNKWFQDKSSDDESDSTELLCEKVVKSRKKSNDSSVLKPSKGWINCFKWGNPRHQLLESKRHSSIGVEDSYSGKIDLSTNFVNFKKTSDMSIISSGNSRQQCEEILSRNLLKNVDDFYTWCEQQMDISTQDLIILKKLRDNAEKKFKALDDNK